MELTNDQKEASKDFLKFLLDKNAREFVLEGYSGCGKTTLVKYLYELAQSKQSLLKYLTDSYGNIQISLTALTHKAAAQLSNTLDRPAITVHSFFGLRVFNDYKNGRTKLGRARNVTVPSNHLVFIDEASMVDSELLAYIRESSKSCKIVWIGDPKQLLPLFSKTAPVFTNPKRVAKLKNVVRQAASNPIIGLATELRLALDGGPMPRMDISRGDEIQHIDGPVFQSLVKQNMGDIDYPKNKYRILAWTNTRIHEYNQYVRQLHTPHETYQKGELLILNSALYPGTKNMIANETELVIESSRPDVLYDIQGHWYRGTCGTYLFAPDDYNDVTQVLNKYKGLSDWVEYYKIKENIADIRPGHASTIHKSQGSTFHTVFIDLDDIGRNNKRDEVIRLLYVAVTRASDQVYLYGSLPDRMYG